ncbi:MAG TPA: hypothetical protein VEQ37_17550 [Actinomycetota bacterium]|nr:hypothetical protein [Actinomycetota bacterium]
MGLRSARAPLKAPYPIPAATRQATKTVATIDLRARRLNPAGILS